MKLSILDQSPISVGQSAKEALENSVKLAQLGEKLGYERFWIAEHHDLYGLACPNPDVMLGIIGTSTKKIRIGAGAVLLPYYRPYRVAETYNLLATMFPGRIDLGIGRAPGGSAEVSMALSDNYLKEVRYFPKKLESLINYLYKTDLDVTPTPVPNESPIVWLLGTSEKSAMLAAEKGLPYAFGHFMTNSNGQEAVQLYRKHFHSKNDSKPYVIVAISVICAQTNEQAYDLALSQFLWKLKQLKNSKEASQIPSVKEAKMYMYNEAEKEEWETFKRNAIIGDPTEVKRQLFNLQKGYKADEWMIVTITHSIEAKFKSYELIAQFFH